MKKAAHFLLLAVLEKSPPNDALTRAYKELDIKVDFFAPDFGSAESIQSEEQKTEFNQKIDDAKRIDAHYGLKWLMKNLFSRRWLAYDYFSCTSEDPVVIAGMLAFIYRKPLIFLSDEIKSGSYRGDKPEYWKKLCRWAMRRARLTIVNDESRIQLQRDYANVASSQEVIVYPGCFLKPPKPVKRRTDKKTTQTIMTYSGGFTLLGGVELALQALHDIPELDMLLQPLGVSELDQLLLKQHALKDRIDINESRLNWQEAWQSMGNADFGVAIYQNQSPQFQNMGISSNRLCMFIAMGIPVITDKQPSFQFIEDFDCGVMVSNQEEFNAAVKKIISNLSQMKRNALRCAEEYINTDMRYKNLVMQIKELKA